MKRATFSALTIAALVACGVPRVARAEETARARSRLVSGVDGVYGRFDGRVALSAGLGAELEAHQPRAAVRVAAHYLWTAGVYGRYSDALVRSEERPAQGRPRHENERSEQALSFGVDLRPLFLPRFALDLEQGPAVLDLTLDSLSLNAGAYWGEAPGFGGHFGRERGFEAGLGFSVPLCGGAHGAFLDLRAERRFADHGLSAWLFTLGLSYQTLIWSTASEAP